MLNFNDLKPETIIGYNLRRLRKERSLKQRQVAAMYEILSGKTCGPKFISAIECGRKWPGGGSLERLAQIFKVEPSEFLKPPDFDKLSFLMWEKIGAIMNDEDRRHLFLEFVEIFLYWDKLDRERKKRLTTEANLLHDFLFPKQRPEKVIVKKKMRWARGE